VSRATDAAAVTTWRDLRDQVERELTQAAIASPDAEARWIVSEVSGYTPAELATHERDEIAPAIAAARVGELVSRRTRGEPLQYVLGAWSFRGIDLMVDPRVLIPRPETEVTAQIAIEEAERLGARRGRRDPWSGSATTFSVADLGTGSGALALALASELPDAEVWAVDANENALAVARANLSAIASSAAARVRIAQGDWFAAIADELRGTLRVVVTNPPYVARHELADLAPEVAHHEPIDALVGGETGLEQITRILADAPEWLEPDGTLVCEIAPHQSDAVVALARDAGFVEVHIRRDLTLRERVLVARRSA
jgi:release factor glutamine methyltransferase